MTKMEVKEIATGLWESDPFPATNMTIEQLQEFVEIGRALGAQRWGTQVDKTKSPWNIVFVMWRD